MSLKDFIHKKLHSYSKLTQQLDRDGVGYGIDDRNDLINSSKENFDNNQDRVDKYIKFHDKYVKYPVTSICNEDECDLIDELESRDALDSVTIYDEKLPYGEQFFKLEYIGDGIIRESSGTSDSGVFIGYNISNDSKYINGYSKVQSYSQSLSDFNPESKKIGNQEWMLEDLAIDDGGPGITKLDNHYYYTYDAAKRIADKVNGWKLPTLNDIKDLHKVFGGNIIHDSKFMYSVYEVDKYLKDMNLEFMGWINPERPDRSLGSFYYWLDDNWGFIGGKGDKYGPSSIYCQKYINPIQFSVRLVKD